MDLSAFDFNLPPERIALRPAVPRESAKLLHVSDSLQDLTIAQLPLMITKGDVVVVNNTRVIPARIQGFLARKEIEILLHQPQSQRSSTTAQCWNCFVFPGKKINVGDVISLAQNKQANVLEKYEDGQVLLSFLMETEAFANWLHTHGTMPIPPYIAKQRAADAQDRQDYQTVYARHEGSVAAPTAGLHMTQSLLDQIKALGAIVCDLTLHVGAGTFLPLRETQIKSGKLHRETIEISQETCDIIHAAKTSGKKIMAVGTTTLRALESAVDAQGALKPFRGETDIFIQPGFSFNIVDCLLTNFHLPKSSLFMLVSAFSGRERMQHAYRHAIEHNYRFYSYGDACLLEREETQ